MARAGRQLLIVTALVSLASCASGPSSPVVQNKSGAAILNNQSVTKAPSRLRYSDGSSKVASFATYYRVPDNTTLTALGQKDFNIVQPDITVDQLSAIQNISYGAVYLAIGELGNNNTYYENGVAKTGQSIYDAHKNDSPKWFLGVNGNFGAYILNLTNPAVRAFVAQQADALLDRGFDGLFLDTADDAEFFSNADLAGSTSQVYVEGAVSLEAGRPDYPTMRRAYIDTIKALRGVAGNALLVQNGGFDLLLDRQNTGDGTQGYVDAVMHEVAITKSNKPGPTADDAVWPFQPENYETWEQYYARQTPTDAARDRAYRTNRDALALDYFQDGGVVFQQDFGHPQNYAVQCASYLYAKNLRASQQKDGWIAAYSDAAFNRVYDYADSTPQIRAIPGCETYDKVTAPDFTTTFAPPSLNTGVGRSATATLNIAAVGGYTGKVNLSLGNLPAGITASLSQTQVTPGAQTQVTLTLNVAASVAANTYIIPVRAQSQGESTRYDLRLKAWKTDGDSVFVAQAGLGKVLAFDGSASLTSSTAPARSLPTASVQQAWNVALDSAGNQYVVDNVAAGKVTRFPSYSLNSGAGVAQVSNLSYPTGLAVDAQNRLWVVQSGSTPGGAAVTTPHVGRYDNAAATESLGFNVDRSLGLGFPQMLALDGSTLWLNTNFGLILKYDVSATPTLSGVYSFPGKLNDLGGGTLTVQNGTLWISGKNAGVSSVMGVNIAALPPANGPFSVNGDAAVSKTIISGLYDPAGLAFDSAGNLWVVNKTGAVGVTEINSDDPGSLIRFPAASLATATPAPNLNIGLGSRYPVGLAVGKP
ncbi:Glycoside-hydrolase family GH114 TIM-barrel domain-containing protein [Deinococcus saxicola]|uniref:hypothetical protein n=1 Tax=Deinococcus saxicola TaxID=249406 RepID=UPI0039EF3C5D